MTPSRAVTTSPSTAGSSTTPGPTPARSDDLGDEHPDLLDDLVRLWFSEAERNQVLPIDDGHLTRIRHMRSPWTAPRLTYDLRPGDKVHEVVGPNIAGGFRMVAAFDGPRRAPGRRSSANRATGTPDGPGTWPRGRSGGAWPARAGPTRSPPTWPTGPTLLVAEGRLVDGSLEVVLSSGDGELGRRRLRRPPARWPGHPTARS